MADLAPDQSGFVEADGQRIYWERFGTGARETICLLNGLAMHTKAWYGFVPMLADEFDVLLWDYLGQGESSSEDVPCEIPRLCDLADSYPRLWKLYVFTSLADRAAREGVLQHTKVDAGSARPGAKLRDLLDLLIAERIVLLYSPSGAGKSSLIHAGLIPRLREVGFQVLDRQEALVLGAVVYARFQERPAGGEEFQVALGALDERGHGPRVWRLGDGRVAPVPVTVVAIEGETARIRGPLAAGDRIVTLGEGVLSENAVDLAGRHAVHVLVRQIVADTLARFAAFGNAKRFAKLMNVNLWFAHFGSPTLNCRTLVRKWRV